MELGENLNYKFYQASKNYNNVLAMLPLAIEDIKTRLLLGENNNNASIEKIKLGFLEFNDIGEIEFIESKQEKENEELLITSSNKLSLIFKEDYKESCEKPQEYVGNLVSRIFVPINNSNISIDYEKEILNYNQYLEIYRQSQDDFVKIAKKLIEKIIGIKLFFDQYDSKNELMKPNLLISNIDNELLINPKNLERLEKYLRTINDKNEFENTIWYAIYPNISMKEKLNFSKGIFKTNINKQKEETNSIENLSSLMNILYKFKIQTFISFERNEYNTFDNLSILGIGKYVEKTKSVRKSKIF